MMLNGGQLERKRLLQPETVAMMTRNQLPEEAPPMQMPAGSPSEKDLAFGLGFGLRMVHDPNKHTPVVGEYFWGGAASTGFAISPRNQTVIIALTQFMPFNPELSDAFIRAVNAAVAVRGRPSR
jgi:CubicO group peptidase (beta-lactamase class C family)